ncbi:MAG TPA: Dabb family protein [Thiotrichaceae bacterium]|jgi:glyceraldehyde-3-phosphate dehydrogenase/erythrose-4-phosphate dehydrogenase|nr:Dabb family protein [Thiotrichaceae bacterium]HIM08003.1 Dabb family protein [Gammaproteobacteria bacterium]
MNKYKFYVLICLSLVSIELSAAVTYDNVIHHQVFLWLNKDVNNDVIDNIISETKKLNTIPGILYLSVGSVISSERDIVDDSYHIGIHMTFKSVADMKTYLQHPYHQEYLRVYVKPVLEKIRVYDFSETIP